LPMHRARDASKLKSSPEAVRGSRKAEGGKSAGTVDESVTGSVNPFSEDLAPSKVPRQHLPPWLRLVETVSPFNN
jgi:hypothetical protein